MPRVRRKHGVEGIHDPNLTPLIDVSLVLVVILLVATPMALQSGIAVSRAADSGRKGNPTRDARIEITIVDAEHVIVNRVPVPRSAMGAVLHPALAENPTRDVVVRCADDVSHGTFVGVLDEIKAQGGARIAVIGG